MNKYWIWLQNSLRYGSHKVRTVRLLYKNIKDFYNAGEMEWRLCGCFTNKEIENLKNNSLEVSEKIIERCNKLNYKIITPDNNSYPMLLREIQNPPCVLYVQGDESCLNSDLPISIVGTRAATRYGTEMAFDISRGIAQKGATVISGGALGIDCAAHEGALEAKGKTVAVLGCGINYPYLLKNSKLRKAISQTGAVISEYPPDFPSSVYTFPMRNRIISGLSLGTVVIEAGEKSGSLITANLANEQNRDVFVVPVNEKSPLAKGALKLIQDGAQVVTCADDVLNSYYMRKLNSSGSDKLFDKNLEYEKDSVDNVQDYRDESNFKDNMFEYENHDTFEELEKINYDLDEISDEDFDLKLMHIDSLDEELYEEEINKNVSVSEKQNKTVLKNIWSDYLEKAIRSSENKFPVADLSNKKVKKSNNNKIKKESIKTPENLSPESEKIHNLLKSGDMHIDDISRETGISIKNLLPILTEMELIGLVKAYSGSIYSLNI